MTLCGLAKSTRPPGEFDRQGSQGQPIVALKPWAPQLWNKVATNALTFLDSAQSTEAVSGSAAPLPGLRLALPRHGIISQGEADLLWVYKSQRVSHRSYYDQHPIHCTIKTCYCPFA